MKKVRILHFTSIINRYDFIDMIIRFGDRNRFVFSACTFTKECNIEKPNYEEIGVEHHVLNVVSTKIGFLKAILKLIFLLRREKIDIVHSHHYYESLIAAIACIFTRSRLVVGRHYHEELYLTTKGLKLKLYLWLEKYTNSIAKAIIAPSSLINELLRKQGVPGGKIFNITYGFDFEAKRYNEYSIKEIDEFSIALGIKGKFSIGNFGRHHPIKGQKYLLEAFAEFLEKYQESVLLMVGDGPIHKDLIGLAEKLNIQSKVKFLGWRLDAHKIMASVDVIVHPTLQEAFPQLMIEAMSLGKPLLICPVSGATDQVKHYQTGVIIPFKDSNAITRELVFIKENLGFGKEIGMNAKEYVHANFNIRKVIKDYENVYASILK